MTKIKELYTPSFPYSAAQCRFHWHQWPGERINDGGILRRNLRVAEGSECVRARYRKESEYDSVHEYVCVGVYVCLLRLSDRAKALFNLVNPVESFCSKIH